MRKLPLPPKIFLLIVFSVFLILSCQKKFEMNIPPKPTEEMRLPQTPAEKHTVAILQEVTSILKDVYQNRKAVYEVNVAIGAGFYEDERVLLKDLLFPEISELYQTEKFKAAKVTVGSFKKDFIKFLKEGNYPTLKKQLENTSLLISTTARTEALIPSDTANEIFKRSDGVSIYFPYSENFPDLIDQSYFDYPNNDAPLITLVNADRVSDTGRGFQPYWCSPGVTMCYRTVTVTDDYAEIKATHIIGVGAGPNRILPSDPPPSTNINRVFVGWMQCTKQYDKLISFTQNGGGSEIKVRRISGYLQIVNHQVTDFTGDHGDFYFKRKEIRKGYWLRKYWVWDPDWVTSNTEQIMAVYEDDTEGTSTFTGGLTTTIVDTISGVPVNVSGNIGFNISVKTQDELILQRKISRTAYFGAAKSDQGWGFLLIDKKGGGSRYDNTFLTTGYWPPYDGNAGNGANWHYTWPYNSY